MTMQHRKLLNMQGVASAFGSKGFPTGSFQHALRLYMCSRFCITCTEGVFMHSGFMHMI